MSATPRRSRRVRLTDAQAEAELAQLKAQAQAQALYTQLDQLYER